MARRKKNNNLRNFGLGALVTTVGVWGYLAYVNSGIQLPKVDLSNIKVPFAEQFLTKKNSDRIQEPVVSEAVENISETVTQPKQRAKVKVFFIRTINDKETYNIMYRENDTTFSNEEFALRCLFAGPTKYEQSKGVYSEIPHTKLLGVKEYKNKIVVNVSGTFQDGGGADSIYKRMYQLIKTANANTNKPVYLMFNGKLVETIGGEGLMLKQPLNGSSLDG